MKNVIKNKNFWFTKKLYGIRKKCWGQICSSQEDIQIFSGLFLNRTRSCRFNCNKRYQNWKIPLCTKSMQDTKKMLESEIFRCKNTHKLVLNYFFIRIMSFQIFIKKDFIKIKNSIFSPKNKRYVSRPATLPPRVTTKSRNQWRDQSNITACVILSTQVIDRSTDQQNDQYGITMCRYNTYTW